MNANKVLNAIIARSMTTGFHARKALQDGQTNGHIPVREIADLAKQALADTDAAYTVDEFTLLQQAMQLDTRRTKQLGVRFTEAELATVKARAIEVGLSPSDYVRSKLEV